MTVIGVTADLKRYSLTESPRPEMIVPYTQKPNPSFTTMQFVVRSATPVAQLLPALRSAIAGVDPGVPVSRQILRQVMIQGIRLATIGVVAGTLLSIVAGRPLQQLLYEVRAFDVVTLAGTGAILAIATVAACLAPAWRASLVEPKAALEDA
jgi:hypothetical protein